VVTSRLLSAGRAAELGSEAALAMNDDRRDQRGNDTVRSHRLRSSCGVAATCILIACLAFVLSASSFGILSMPIILIGLIVGWFGRSRLVRWPALSAVGAVLAMYLFLILTGR
jgi:hypothetical protein